MNSLYHIAVNAYNVNIWTFKIADISMYAIVANPVSSWDLYTYYASKNGRFPRYFLGCYPLPWRSHIWLEKSRWSSVGDEYGVKFVPTTAVAQNLGSSFRNSTSVFVLVDNNKQ